jgi:ABC-type proline/glycine betaine transport system permease subunit
LENNDARSLVLGALCVAALALGAEALLAAAERRVAAAVA